MKNQVGGVINLGFLKIEHIDNEEYLWLKPWSVQIITFIAEITQILGGVGTSDSANIGRAI